MGLRKRISLVEYVEVIYDVAADVPAERVFSTVGLIVNCQRASLSPDNFNMLVFFKQKHVNYSDCQLLINFNNY